MGQRGGSRIRSLELLTGANKGDAQPTRGVRISADPSSLAGSNLADNRLGIRSPGERTLARKRKDLVRKRNRAAAQHVGTDERKPGAGRLAPTQ